MPISIDEYLDEDGAVEVLCAIQPGGSRFTKLEKEVSISEPTLSKRLAQGREAGLFEEETIRGERGTSNQHVLSHKGGILWMKLQTLSVMQSYQRYNDARKEFNQKCELIQEWVTQNPDTLDDPTIGFDELFSAIHADSNPLPDWESGEE